jgi:hypothetical protein
VGPIVRACYLTHILRLLTTANIIVAETAARLDASMAIDFFRHFRVCFWVTLVSCTVGALLITAMVEIEIATVG